MTQYLIILGGSVIDVVEAADAAAIQNVLADRYAFPDSFIALDASEVVTKEIVARSIELLDRKSAERGTLGTDQK